MKIIIYGYKQKQFGYNYVSSQFGYCFGVPLNTLNK